MCLKRLHGQNNRFRKIFIACLLLLATFYVLFDILNNPTEFRFILLTFSNSTSTSKPPQCLMHECTVEQSEKHGNLFASYSHDWSGCYGDFFLPAFDNHDTPVAVLIDIGANKGYAVATWLAFFLPELGINQAGLGTFIKDHKGLPEPCGSCNDCKDHPLKRKNVQQKLKLQIHAIEPQPGTVAVLKDVRNWMKINESNDLKFEIHGMAVGDQTGQALFKKCNPGNEVCSLDVSGVVSSLQISVNITTLDDFATQNHLSKIDIIKMDTEGYDPLVIRGAKRLLEEHRIRLFIFEHLTEGAWKNTSLKQEVLNLSKLGYVCYIVGKNGLIRASNCWSDKFDVRHNNLLCVSSKDTQLFTNIDEMRVNGTVASKCQTIS